MVGDDAEMVVCGDRPSTTEEPTAVQLQALLASIASTRAEVLAALQQLALEEMERPTSAPRWSEVRRILLRFGDHMREHAMQITATREALGCSPTMPQRMLGAAQEAHGVLLASVIALNDDDLDRTPGRNEWSIRQVLDHTLESERQYLAWIEEARQSNKPA